MGKVREMMQRRSRNGEGPGNRDRTPRPVSLVLIILLLLLTGACGGDDEASETESSAADAAQAAMSEPPAPMTTMAAAEHEAPTALEAAVEELLEAAVAGPADGDAATAMEEPDEEMAMEPASDEMEDMEDADADQRLDLSAGGAVLEVSTTYTPSAFGRDVIYRARVSVEAADVAVATGEAIAIVQGLGGFVFGQQTYTRPQPYSEIVFKVLPEDFSVALSRLSRVGELIDQQISADDVTERIVDLQSQIITAEASVARLRRFLDTASNLENLAFYERELVVRETDLERLRGQLRTLEDHVSLATITLAISQLPDRPIILPNTGLLVTAWVSTDAEDPCLGSKNLIVERDDTVHFCVEVANEGEVTLTDIEFYSDVLPLDENPFLVERGSLDRIDPGQFLTATLTEEVTAGRMADRIATRGLEVLIEATATPVDDDVPQLGVISDRTRVSVTAVEVIPSTGVFINAWVSGDDDDPCLGAETVTVEPDDDTVNFCVFVGNPGQVPITDIEVRSTALDFDSNPLTLEHGDFTRIEPGQFLTATLTETVAKGRLNGRVATRGLDIEIESTATPVDFDGSEMEVVSDTTGVNVFAQEILPTTRIIATAWASTDDDDPCLGNQNLSVDPDADAVHFCLEIGNLSEVPLTDLVVSSTALPLDDNPFVAEQGDFDRLEPGRFLTATLTEPIRDGRLAGRIAIRGVSIEIEATATPVDADGSELEEVSDTTNVSVDVWTTPADEPPSGFGEALAASFETLVSIVGGLAVVVGALIPFLPFIALLVAVLWWIRRRRRPGSGPPEPAEAERSSPTDE